MDAEAVRLGAVCESLPLGAIAPRILDLTLSMREVAGRQLDRQYSDCRRFRKTQALQLAWLLEKNGWEVIRVSCGEAAVEELNRNLPALMIVDYHFPGIPGDELCRGVG